MAHAHTPHLYVTYWPDLGMLKVGISTRARWSYWRNTGAVEIATIDTCCIPHAHRIEQWLLSILAGYGSPAFGAAGDAKRLLGGKGAGYSECFLLPPSDLRGEPPSSPYDYERGYGLRLPAALGDELSRFHAAWHEIQGTT